MSRFSGKTVVVTGASRGIGAALARRFAREGASVVVSANEPAAETVAADIVASGGKAIAQIADVTNKADVVALYDAAEREFGGVDVSIQNAGVITIARIEAMTEAEWDKVMAVNTKGVFLCCQEAIARMRKHKRGGRLINTASGQARQGFIYTPHYAASKFGVVGITQSLAKEVAKEGITVNAFCPGIIETDMWAYNDEVWGKLLGNIQARRTDGRMGSRHSNGPRRDRRGRCGPRDVPRERRRSLHHRADDQRRWRVNNVLKIRLLAARTELAHALAKDRTWRKSPVPPSTAIWRIGLIRGWNQSEGVRPNRLFRLCRWPAAGKRRGGQDPIALRGDSQSSSRSTKAVQTRINVPWHYDWRSGIACRVGAGPRSPGDLRASISVRQLFDFAFRIASLPQRATRNRAPR